MALVHARPISWWVEELKSEDVRANEGLFIHDRLHGAEVLVQDVINRLRAVEQIAAGEPDYDLDSRESQGERINRLENAILLLNGASLRELGPYRAPGEE